VPVIVQEVSRTRGHVYIEARTREGHLAYAQMIPKKDFKAAKHLGQFQWGGKVFDV
jgi:hypothetical protein